MNAVERAERLLELTENWFPFDVDPTAVTTEELALAGVVCCRRLLHGIVVLHDQPDLAGTMARSLYETWLCSVYLLRGEAGAYERLQATDDYLQRWMAQRLPTGRASGVIESQLKTR